MQIPLNASVLAGLALPVLVAWTAAAAPAPPPPGVAAAFGNTVLSIYPDGRSQKIWLQPDGTWTGQGRAGQPLAGQWRIQGAQVCLRQTRPPTLPLSLCRTFPADAHVGSSWSSRDVLGTPVQLKVVNGVTLNAGGS
ncbi:MAG: hypothetical protein JWQ46_2512 [Phenylobacterium sp.]|nr:hypothetical protein [Phenylobacterium sp.]